MADIFEQLEKIDSFDIEAIKDEEFFKEFNPYMINKWMAATTNPKRVLLVNELLNSMLFQLHKEKKLLYYLACASSTGPERYSWVKRPKNTPDPVVAVVADYYGISHREAKISLQLLENDDILEMVEDLGLDKKEVKKIKKHL